MRKQLRTLKLVVHDGKLPGHFWTRLKDFPFLEKLVLKNCGMDVLPKTIGVFVNLQELQLVSNALTRLPEEIGHLKALTWLNLRCNPQLTTLPRSLLTLAPIKGGKLTRLNLGSIPITASDQGVSLDALRQAFDEHVYHNDLNVFEEGCDRNQAED